jgi:pimeloyl-ACP methyl ester carboxylesterase
MSVRAWWAGGERVPVAEGRVFVRLDGPPGAPLVTLLHGFPTSSYDWAPVVERLRDRRRLLTLDFLGFGDSDKPGRYSLLRQAGVVQAVWARLGVERTALVAHDYGVSVAQELLARRTGVAIERLALLNGGLIPSLHRPLPVQAALAHPVSGPLLTHLVSERTFAAGLHRVCARPLADAELHEHWLALTNRGGRTHAHALLTYIAERRAHATRWEAALQHAGMPLTLVWGPEDPVSGAHMLAEVRRRRPDASVRELAGVGHYPQLEAPDATAAALAEAT